MSTTRKAPSSSKTKHASNRSHPLKWMKVQFVEATFEDVYQEHFLKENPGEHATIDRMARKIDGTPIRGKWVYVFEARKGINACIHQKRVEGDFSLSLSTATAYVVFLSSQELSKKRLDFYTQQKNHRSLSDRGFAFIPSAKRQKVYLLDILELTTKLANSYRRVCLLVQDIASNPQMHFAQLVEQVAQLNREFNDAAQDEIPEILNYARKGIRKLETLRNDMVLRKTLLEELKYDCAFGAAMEDLLDDPSTHEAAIRTFDACTCEEELDYFRKLTAPGPKRYTWQSWYEDFQKIRPLEQAIGAGGTYTALRKLLVLRFMKIEQTTVPLSSFEGSREEVKELKKAYKKALNNFATEVEGILSSSPELRSQLENSGTGFFHLVEQEGSGPRFQWKFKTSSDPLSATFARLQSDSRFHSLLKVEALGASVCAAFEIINMLSSAKALEFARSEGREQGTAQLGFASDLMTGLGSIAGMGYTLTKFKPLLGLTENEMAVAATGLGRCAIGLGLFGSIFGVIKAGEEIADARDTDEIIDKSTSLASNSISLVVGALQFAGSFGIEGNATALAAGPYGVIAVLAIGILSSYMTWRCSNEQRLLRWPDTCHSGSVGHLSWKDYSVFPIENVQRELLRNARSLLKLAYPFQVGCRLERQHIPLLHNPGGSGELIRDTLVLRLEVGAWLGESAHIELSNLISPSLFELPGLPQAPLRAKAPPEATPPLYQAVGDSLPPAPWQRPKPLSANIGTVFTSKDWYRPSPNQIEIRLALPSPLQGTHPKYEFEVGIDVFGDGRFCLEPAPFSGLCQVIDQR